MIYLLKQEEKYIYQRGHLPDVNQNNLKRHPNKLWYVADVNLVAFHRNYIHHLAVFFFSQTTGARILLFGCTSEMKQRNKHKEKK